MSWVRAMDFLVTGGPRSLVSSPWEHIGPRGRVSCAYRAGERTGKDCNPQWSFFVEPHGGDTMSALNAEVASPPLLAVDALRHPRVETATFAVG